MELTANGRTIVIVESKNRVSRIRIRPTELYILLSAYASSNDEWADRIFDSVFLLEATIPPESNTLNIRIDDKGDPDYLQIEKGNTKETRFVRRGVDFGVIQ